MHLQEFWRRVGKTARTRSWKSFFTPSGIVAVTLVVLAAIVVVKTTTQGWRASPRAGSTYEIPLDLLAVGGKVYTNTTLLRYNPAYAVVVFYDGFVRMAISNLPAGYQTQFGYAPDKAAQFLAEQALGKKKRRATLLAQQLANQRSDANTIFGPVAPAPYAGFQFYTCNAEGGLDSTEGAFTNAINVIKANGLQQNFPWLIEDDGWYTNTPDPKVATAITKNFPHGMQWIINYGHTNGFKMGLYFSVSFVVDSGYPSYDINQNLLHLNVSNYIAWGVDMVFIDHVNSTERAGTEMIISAFRKAALANNRPLRVIINNNETTDFQPWMQEADGVNCHADGSPVDFPNGFLGIFSQIQNQIPFSGYDCWPDFNTVGTWKNNTNYFKASMGILSMAPFSYFMGTTNWNAATLRILTNTTLRTIHQDMSGRMWNSIPSTASGRIWARKLADGSTAVILYNAALDTNTFNLGMSPSPTNIAFSLASIGIPTNQVENADNVFGQTRLAATNSFNWMVNSNSAEVFVFSLADPTASAVATHAYGCLFGTAVNINTNHQVDAYDSGQSGGTISCNPPAGTITVTNAGKYLVSGTVFVRDVPGTEGVSIGVLTNATLAFASSQQIGSPVLPNGCSALSFSGVVLTVPAMTTFAFSVDNRQPLSAQQATLFIQKL